MSHITLTEDQFRVVARSCAKVEVRDAHGEVIGYLELVDFTPEEIAEAKNRGRRARD